MFYHYRYSDRIRTVFTLLFASLVFWNPNAMAAELTQEEVAQIESELGITLTSQEKMDLAGIIRPDGPVPQWRQDAEERIEQRRKANLRIKVIDQQGNPVPDANVEVNLRSHAFRFGGVLDLKDFNDANGALQISTDRYRELFLKLYNAAGLNNGLKIKQRAGNEPLLPGFFDWAQANRLPVRGHTLIWPGTPNSNHMPADILADVEAVELAIANSEPSATIDSLKETLRLNINAMIAEWASKWPVYEWDVINEPITNHRVQDLIGYDQMAEWFKIAKQNTINPDCKLLLNEYQVISARSPELDTNAYSNRSSNHKTNLDLVIDNGGPLDRLGFQSRFKFEHPDPAMLYNRLEEFSNQYGGVMVGTEFEIRDNTNPNYYPYDFTELERGQVTEEVLTTYFSHPKVDGLFAWTYMKADEFSMCYLDGTIKLNALVWYYLHRIRYNTSRVQGTASDGTVSVRGFKGSYDLKVVVEGLEYPVELELEGDMTYQVEVQLQNPPVTWGQFPVTSDVLVDTDSWLGWLQVDNDPWIWSFDQNKWLYIPMVTAEMGSGWVYWMKF